MPRYEPTRYHALFITFFYSFHLVFRPSYVSHLIFAPPTFFSLIRPVLLNFFRSRYRTFKRNLSDPLYERTIRVRRILGRSVIAGYTWRRCSEKRRISIALYRFRVTINCFLSSVEAILACLLPISVRWNVPCGSRSTLSRRKNRSIGSTGLEIGRPCRRRRRRRTSESRAWQGDRRLGGGVTEGNGERRGRYSRNPSDELAPYTCSCIIFR